MIGRLSGRHLGHTGSSLTWWRTWAWECTRCWADPAPTAEWSRAQTSPSWSTNPPEQVHTSRRSPEWQVNSIVWKRLLLWNLPQVLQTQRSKTSPVWTTTWRLWNAPGNEAHRPLTTLSSVYFSGRCQYQGYRRCGLKFGEWNNARHQRKEVGASG